MLYFAFHTKKISHLYEQRRTQFQITSHSNFSTLIIQANGHASHSKKKGNQTKNIVIIRRKFVSDLRINM